MCPTHIGGPTRTASPADEYPRTAQAPPDIREGGRPGTVHAGIVQTISLHVGGARPEQRHAAQHSRRIDCHFQFGRIVGGDDNAGLGTRLGSQPNEGRRSFMAPKRLAILCKPTFDGRTVEGYPHLTVLGAAILLHVAARVVDQRRQRRVILGRATTSDANQHGLHCGLEGRGLRRLRAVGHGRRRLIQFRTGQRERRIPQAECGHA
jgi:hypothetical protein